MRTKSGLTAAAIRTSELYGVVVQALGESAPYSDDAIEENILAAESYYQRELGIRFGVKRIASAARERGLVLGVDYDEEETPYTYPPDFFSGDKWGHLELRKRPVLDVSRLAFAFPNPAQIMFELDRGWVRVDHAKGQLNIIPTSGPTVLLALNGQVMSLVGGAWSLPKSVLVDYTVGFTYDQLRGDYADLLKAIRLRASLFLLPGLGTALTGGRTSRSLGMDGMSEGGGFQTGKYGPYSGMIEAAMEQEKMLRDSLMQSIHGIRMVVL
jgi:hypothetical protein